MLWDCTVPNFYATNFILHIIYREFHIVQFRLHRNKYIISFAKRLFLVFSIFFKTFLVNFLIFIFHLKFSYLLGCVIYIRIFVYFFLFYRTVCLDMIINIKLTKEGFFFLSIFCKCIITCRKCSFCDDYLKKLSELC